MPYVVCEPGTGRHTEQNRQLFKGEDNLRKNLLQRVFTSTEGLPGHKHHIESNLINLYTSLPSIVYRSKKTADDILVKCLMNGEEATLPVPTTSYPYYKWSDFKNFYSERCNK